MAKKKPGTEVAKAAKPKAAKAPRPTCGIVMPISGSEPYSETHWLDVLEIICEALDKAGFDSRLVSQSDETKVIHENIVKSLQTMDMVVVDVSSKNPNVMFELGMRVTFNKPLVLIKDDLTTYSFDVGNIDTIGYPSTLHYQSIQKLKQAIITKVKATYEASKKPGYDPFLGYYKIIEVSTLEHRQVPQFDLIVELLKQVLEQKNTVQAQVVQQPPVRTVPAPAAQNVTRVTPPGTIPVGMVTVPLSPEMAKFFREMTDEKWEEFKKAQMSTGVTTIPVSESMRKFLEQKPFQDAVDRIAILNRPFEDIAKRIAEINKPYEEATAKLAKQLEQLNVPLKHLEKLFPKIPPQ